ncbi:hypothetical protein BJ741DRAFT_637765 [Chytriomyces cf. hyalinus JEL632]|nr:hypothetical protein BJ741DRAFT_637765 [Chytriomyces cf. hyalinus JEL632]
MQIPRLALICIHLALATHAAPIFAGANELAARDPGNWCDPVDCNPMYHPEKRDVVANNQVPDAIVEPSAPQIVSSGPEEQQHEVQESDLAKRDPGNWCDPVDCNPMYHPEKRDEEAAAAQEVQANNEEAAVHQVIENSDAAEIEKRDPALARR